MSKVKKSSSKVPTPFDLSSYKTERTAAAILMHWMRVIIEEENLDLGLPDVETSASDRKMPDLVIYESRRSKQVLCLIEAKLPYFDPFSESDLKEPARKKAAQRRAKYFGTTNFKKLIWYNTARVNQLKPEEEQIIEKYELSGIENVNEIENFKYSEPTKKALKVFLKKLLAVSTGKEAEPKQALDDLLIFRIQEKIRILSTYYTSIIEDQAHKDSKFLKELRTWFAEQGWNFTLSDDDYKKAARQTAYLLINKILFYDLLQIKRPDQLDPLEIPEGLTRSSLLQSYLQGYFNEVLNIDYETIYTTDFIDIVAFPNHKEIVKEIKEFVKILKRYDFTNLGFDIIGRIFERIIPEEERHILGQYFTNADVIDLILRFCLKHEDDKVLDPSCGAGTFLVRAYQHKKLMNQLKDHVDILDSLWGNDIAKFPAHLATINLAINDLTQDRNYPNILQEDFFALHVGKNGFEAESWRKRRAKTLGKEVKEITYPRWFDVIIGNPPYTRQEEIPDIGVDKEKLIESALTIGDKKIADISKRAGLPAYFFVHGTKFLKNDGYFGFIVSSLWMDSDYGTGLQEFFLQNYKIIAIIESKIERWFFDADINTCIIILQKCNSEIERGNNLVRFVNLKKNLRDLVTPIQKIWERQLDRMRDYDSLIRTILGHDSAYQNDDLKIFPVSQKFLWDEGYSEEENKYVGSNWAKYIRAPEILFDILKSSQNSLNQLQDFVFIRRGITSGVNEFFYLKQEEILKWEIEKKYLQPILFSLKEAPNYLIDKNVLSRKVIICAEDKQKLKGKKLLKYIDYGEKEGFHKRPTCQSRKPWYGLAKNWEYAPLIFPAKVGERLPVLKNDGVFEDKKLYGIFPNNKKQVNLIGGILNSTITRLFVEFSSRQLTGAQAIADIDVKVVNQLPFYDLRKIKQKTRRKIIEAYKKLLRTKAESIFLEVAPYPESVDLDKIKPERRALDEIVMGEVFGLNVDQQIHVYKAVVDLVRTRIDKAESTQNSSLGGTAADLYKMKSSIVYQIKESTS